MEASRKPALLSLLARLESLECLGLRVSLGALSRLALAIATCKQGHCSTHEAVAAGGRRRRLAAVAHTLHGMPARSACRDACGQQAPQQAWHVDASEENSRRGGLSPAKALVADQ